MTKEDCGYNKVKKGFIMPHFVIDCSEDILSLHKEEKILEQVNILLIETKLFHENDIKIRINFYKKYITGNKKENFIHVFANIMQGRCIEQKVYLSKTLVGGLSSMFPSLKHIGCNVVEFERASYFNKNMLDPNYEFSMPKI